jgi:hypothetical protein
VPHPAQDADRVAALMFVLRLLTGGGVMPTVAPNLSALLGGRLLA